MDSQRLPPCSEHAEVGLLGSLLQQPKTVLFLCHQQGITEEHFYLPAHRAIFREILALASARGPDRIDLLTVTHRLQTTGRLDQIGGEVSLHRLIDATPTAAHAGHYAELVTSSWRKRRLIEVCRATEGQAYEGDNDPVSLASSLVSEASALSVTTEAKPTPREHHEAAIQGWITAKNKGSMGWPSKWDEVENLIGSYMAPEQIIIAARPSDGKTTFASEEVIHKARIYQIPCAFASLDSTERQLRILMAGSLAGVSTFRMRRGQWTPEDMEKMKAAFQVLEGLPIYIDDTPRSIDSLEASLITMKAKHGIGLFVVDYLQLIVPSQHKEWTQNEIVGEFSSRLKRLAKKLNVASLILSQLSRGGHRDKTVSPPTPSLEALRSSGVIEQDADKVLMLCKEPGLDMSEFDLDQDWPTEVHVLKNKTGPTGKIHMTFMRSQQRWITRREFQEINVDNQARVW